MPNTKAYAAHAAKAPLAPFSFDRRAPGDYDVAIDIRFCGICHTDIHQTRDEWGEGMYPMVPGHEIAGVVTSVGKHVTKFKPGDHVGVGCFVDSCRTCAECKRGEEQYCSVATVFTYASADKEGRPTYGGYSDKIVVDENYVLRIPDNLSLDGAAPLLCAGITLYSPLKHWGAGPGKKVGIIGLGGLGHMGVKLAHAMGAEVTVFSQSLKKQADGKRLGADHFYATSDPATFENLRKQFDLIVNTVPAASNWDQFVDLLTTDGSLVMVGVPDDAVPVNGFPLIARRRSIAGSMIGGIAETQEMLDFCGKHNIVSDIERIPMQKVNEAFERVVRGDVRYRFVIDCASLA
ncbi:MAG TPA: NAD(P)-dependent alcohol dehydrogenase [Bryobacteraceae bacterium]|nr:NAD(P)-dependent alcohol dehydrogenase [Bryobacteraceae bacterium]